MRAWIWKGGRVVDGTSLENWRGACRHRGFESRPFRQDRGFLRISRPKVRSPKSREWPVASTAFLQRRARRTVSHMYLLHRSLPE